MTVSLAEENELVKAISLSIGSHHALDPRDYRADGRIIVTRDNLRTYLHRELYRRIRGPVARNEFLIRACDYDRCLNPFHYTLASIPRMPLTHCSNGHEYIPSDILPSGKRRCGRCYEARAALRRTGAKQHWQLEKERQFCPQGHPYVKENLYVYPTKTGVRRKCRTCTIARARGEDPADVVYR